MKQLIWCSAAWLHAVQAGYSRHMHSDKTVIAGDLPYLSVEKVANWLPSLLISRDLLVVLALAKANKSVSSFMLKSTWSWGNVKSEPDQYSTMPAHNFQSIRKQAHALNQPSMVVMCVCERLRNY